MRILYDSLYYYVLTLSLLDVKEQSCDETELEDRTEVISSIHIKELQTSTQPQVEVVEPSHKIPTQHQDVTMHATDRVKRYIHTYIHSA